MNAPENTPDNTSDKAELFPLIWTKNVAAIDEVIDAILKRAREAGARISQGPERSRVAYSFTAVDPDGNQWWVNAETGFLDTLRGKTHD